jgi:UDPglucose 6-dehydrogenase
MKVCVIGTGYVGLVAGTCFAESGNDVICVDVDEAKIALLQNGKVPIYEPGLEELITRNSEEGRLHFNTDLPAAVRASQICFIAVGTPTAADGSADLRYVEAAATQIADAMDGYRVIVNKSTVPVGMAERVRQIIATRTDHPFDVVSNPEFLKEGAAVQDFMNPDRVVIGSQSPRAIDIMRDLYSPFVRTERPILVMSAASAEMTKYAANSMLATRISLINEFANLCERVGGDIADVRRGVGFDERIGQHFLFPGVGYGGSCFPKDIKAIIRTAGEQGLSFGLLRAVEDVNEAQKRLLPEKVLRHFGSDLSGLRFAIWGLSFKPRTDDMREAPSIVVINSLLEAGAEVRAYDPEAMEEAKHVFGDRISYERSNYEALEGADALLIVTEWNEFRRPDFQRMAELMRNKVVFDGRNVYELSQMQALGFTYYSIGRPSIGAQA